MITRVPFATNCVALPLCENWLSEQGTYAADDSNTSWLGKGMP